MPRTKQDIINRPANFELRQKRTLREAFGFDNQPVLVKTDVSEESATVVVGGEDEVFEIEYINGVSVLFNNFRYTDVKEVKEGDHFTVIIRCADAADYLADQSILDSIGSGSLTFSVNRAGTNVLWPLGVEPTFTFQSGAKYIYSFVVDSNLDVHGRLAFKSELITPVNHIGYNDEIDPAGSWTSFPASYTNLPTGGPAGGPGFSLTDGSNTTFQTAVNQSDYYTESGAASNYRRMRGPGGFRFYVKKTVTPYTAGLRGWALYGDTETLHQLSLNTNTGAVTLDTNYPDGNGTNVIAATYALDTDWWVVACDISDLAQCDGRVVSLYPSYGAPADQDTLTFAHPELIEGILPSRILHSAPNISTGAITPVTE